MTNKKVCIKGDGTEETGKRIINYLEGLGGVNSNCLKGGLAVYYFINDKNEIYCRYDLPAGYELATLPEPTPEKTFPREMWVWDTYFHNRGKMVVDGMYKDKYIANRDDRWYVFNYAKEIDSEQTNPLTTDEKIADLQKQIDELKNMMK